MKKPLSTQRLSAEQLASYVGSPCFINNGRNVVYTKLNFMMLYEYDKGGVRMIVPILKRLDAITPEQGQYISKQSYYVDGFALNFIKKVADASLHNFHIFVAEWAGTDCYGDLQQMGLDPFGLINKGQAIDSDSDYKAEYSIDEFQEIFFQ